MCSNFHNLPAPFVIFLVNGLRAALVFALIICLQSLYVALVMSRATQSHRRSTRSVSTFSTRKNSSLTRGVKLGAWMMLLFEVFWLPSLSVQIFQYFCNCKTGAGFAIYVRSVGLFRDISAALNPFIYAKLRRRNRIAYHYLLTHWRWSRLKFYIARMSLSYKFISVPASQLTVQSSSKQTSKPNTKAVTQSVSKDIN